MIVHYKKLLIGMSITASLVGSTTMYAASFKDVKETHWAYSAVEWGVSKGITNGYEDGSFKPSTFVSEEEFVSMLIRSYKGTLTADGGRWSDPYYAIAGQNNYPVGSSRNAKITRQAVAEIIAGTQGKNFTGDNAIKFMLVNGLAGGKTSNTVAGFAGKETLTRAEALVFIKNVLDKTGSADLQTRPSTPSDTIELGNEEVPLGGIDAVDGYDAKLEAIAKKFDAALGTGFSAGYNKGQDAAFIRNPEGGIIMAYSDNTINGERTQAIVLEAMLNAKTDTVRADRLNAVLAAMGAVGLPNGADVKAAITKGLEDASTTVKSGGVTLEILAVSYGRVVIYVD